MQLPEHSPILRTALMRMFRSGFVKSYSLIQCSFKRRAVPKKVEMNSRMVFKHLSLYKPYYSINTTPTLGLQLSRVHTVGCFRGVQLPESIVVAVHSLFSESGNSADQPDLFTPFYSCLLDFHIAFQVIKTSSGAVRQRW